MNENVKAAIYGTLAALFLLVMFAWLVRPLEYQSLVMQAVDWDVDPKIAKLELRISKLEYNLLLYRYFKGIEDRRARLFFSKED